MVIRRGAVHWAEFDPVRGHEQRGRRPALVISRDEINDLPLTVLVMAGTGAENLDPDDRQATDLWTTASETGMPKDTVFMGLQIRSIDRSRLGARIGVLPPARLAEVLPILRFVIGADTENVG
jgi:mRNA interferase MazF